MEVDTTLQPNDISFLKNIPKLNYGEKSSSILPTLYIITD